MWGAERNGRANRTADERIEPGTDTARRIAAEDVVRFHRVFAVVRPIAEQVGKPVSFPVGSDPVDESCWGAFRNVNLAGHGTHESRVNRAKRNRGAGNGRG